VAVCGQHARSRLDPPIDPGAERAWTDLDAARWTAVKDAEFLP